MRLPLWNSTLLAASSMFATRSPVCVADPPLLLDAGASGVSVLVDMPAQVSCEAAIHFAGASFLPMRYFFDAAMPCQGLRTLNFTVPKGAPNGDARVVWQCAGVEPMCYEATVRGGLGNQQGRDGSHRTGDVGCVTQVLATKTVQVTRTGALTTFVEAIPTVVTQWETSFLEGSQATPRETSFMESSESTPREWSKAGATSRDKVAGTPGTGLVRQSPDPRTNAGGVGGGVGGEGGSASEARPTATASILTVSVVSTLTILHTITANATCSS